MIVTILDNINFHLSDVDRATYNAIRNKLKLPVKGAYSSPAFRNKIWDGMECQFTEDGLGYVYDLGTVLDVLYDMGIEYDVVDKRTLLTTTLSPITDDFLIKETGYTLYDYQLHSINELVRRYNTEGRGGVVKLATNAGKSSVVMGLVKLFNNIHKTLTIVPNADLVKQLEKDFIKLGVNYSSIQSKHSDAKRKELIKKSDHLIMTSGLFNNIANILERTYVIMVDECHRWGDVFTDNMRKYMGNSPVIIGLTATMPADEVKGVRDDVYKDHMIRCFCNEDLYTVEQSELVKRGISSSMLIHQIILKDEKFDKLSKIDNEWDWSKELVYMTTNIPRLEAISEYLDTLFKKVKGNTMVLCPPSVGNYLSERFDRNNVTQETDGNIRQEWYNTFANSDDYILFASFGCAGTGISINNIQNMVFIDIGKDKTLIKQAVGRGLRLDGGDNHIDIYDISGNTKYSVNHRRDRLHIYRDEEFTYTENKVEICF